MRGISDPFLIPQQAKSKKEGLITEAGQSREVSEAFLADRSQALWLGRVVTAKKFSLLLSVLLVIFLILFSRLFYLQLIRGQEFKSLAEGNRLRLEFITPPRGIIFDRFGRPLVKNIPTFTLFFQASELSSQAEQRSVIVEILQKLGLKREAVDYLLKSESYLPQAVKENLSYEEALKLMLATQELSALKIVIDPQREYLKESGLAHLLGYTSRITQEEKEYFLDLGYQLTEKVGRAGLENYYQDFLRGQPGQKQIEVDAFGRESKVMAEAPAQSGRNLFLTIDQDLQEKIYQVFKNRLPFKAGAAIALDPQSGGIRALLSWPTFAANRFSQGISPEAFKEVIDNPLKPLFNRAVAGEYPPGSTIKLMVGLAGLAEGLVNKNSTIYSSGGLWYDKWFFPDWRAGGHGYANIIKAIAESVNTYFYYLALEDFDGHKGLGLERMISYFRQFGLGKILGLDLPGEKAGFLPSPEWKKEVRGEIWYPGDTLHLAIGQGDILLTPLQVAGFTSVIASGGTLYKPHLVEKITNVQTTESQVIKSEIINRLLTAPENLTIIAQGMRAAVTSGSARQLADLRAPLAGKTGTAQVAGEQKPHGWFTGFLPYDHPNLVLTVLVEHGGEGTELAVPIARDILSWYIENRL